MAGYRNGLNKSTNAVVAETRGFFPIETVAKRLKLPISFLRNYCDWAETEWHHLNKNYLKVDYMNLAEVKLWINNNSEINKKAGDTFESSYEEWKNKQETKVNPPVKFKPNLYYPVIVEWLELEGTHRYPKVKYCKDENALALDKGNHLIQITLSNGTKFKKSKYSKGFKITRKGEKIVISNKISYKNNSIKKSTIKNSPHKADLVEKVLMWYKNLFAHRKKVLDNIK
jgi:hypothetical protein